MLVFGRVGLSDVVRSKCPNKFHDFKKLTLWRHHFRTLGPFPLPSEHLNLIRSEHFIQLNFIKASEEQHSLLS